MSRWLLILVVMVSHTVARTVEAEEEKVIGLFEGVWRNEIVREGRESPEKRKLSSNEVISKSLKGRYLIGREMNPQSGAKFMWFLTYEPQSQKYAWTFFSTLGLLGTEWTGTWDNATSTLTSKSSDAPPTWTSEAVNKFVGRDTVEANAWMKDDKGSSIFAMSVTKTRQPSEKKAEMLNAWKSEAMPAGDFSPQLKLLDRLQGTWDVTAHFKKTEWTPEEKRQKSTVVRMWVLNRMFLQDVSNIEDGNEGISLFTYDQKRSEYRSWWFSSEGYASKSSGQWDPASNSLRMKSTLPDGQSSEGSVHFTDDDRHEWKVLVTDNSGKVYFDCVWYCIRAKP